MKYIVIACLILTSCTLPESKTKRPLTIVCTTGMLGDAVSNMVHDSCVVNVLMGPGTDPHLYKPTKESLDLLSSADVIVANGLHLEGRMQDVLEKLARTKPVIFAGDGIGADMRIYLDDKGKIPDPHIWFDVALWQQAVKYIQRSLIKSAAECHSPTKAATYEAALGQLDGWVKTEIESIPREQRVLITAHDAFGYFGKAYDMEVIGLQGISTMAEYGIRDVANLVNEITRREIKAVFVESSVSTRSIEAVIAGCRERGFEVAEGGTLYSDALGSADGPAGNYVGMVKSNVSTIKAALQ